MPRICVFCGASPQNGTEFTEFARRVGRRLATKRIGVVFGGGAYGMMGALAEGAAEISKDIIGVAPQFLLDRESRHPLVDDMRIVASMHERKLLMHALSDGFIALPGGFGTLEEMFEVLTWRQLGLHQKPLAFVGEGQWYDYLRNHFSLLLSGGFISSSNLALAPILQGEGGLDYFIQLVEEFAAQGKGDGTELESKT
jgi:uncharacterized protein (TIGR00730 family)